MKRLIIYDKMKPINGKEMILSANLIHCICEKWECWTEEWCGKYNPILEESNIV